MVSLATNQILIQLYLIVITSIQLEMDFTLKIINGQNAIKLVINVQH